MPLFRVVVIQPEKVRVVASRAARLPFEMGRISSTALSAARRSTVRERRLDRAAACFSRRARCVCVFSLSRASIPPLRRPLAVPR